MSPPPADHVDAVVVGSGFGGAVAAYRLAEAGWSVRVLERGKAYPPGSFARRPREMATNFWDPSRGHHGLFDVWSFRGIEALVASGLGGGSLVYANVLLRKDERWFVHERPFGNGGVEHWPIGRQDLDPHYGAVERMIGVQQFPLGVDGYPQTPKTIALRDAASRLAASGSDMRWALAPLAVTFANEGQPPALGELIPAGDHPNIHGAERRTCRLCGECNIGCNDGAKNTLDLTYLSGAATLGADIRTRCHVRTIVPRQGGGYAVGYVQYTGEDDGVSRRIAKMQMTTVTCDRLVMAAGALGSPTLLLRNRSALPDLGPALGTRFSGNGDTLSFLMRAQRPDGGAGVLDGSHGPVITSYVRVPDEVDGGDGAGHYVEDAGYPIAIDWMLEVLSVPGATRRMLRMARNRLSARLSRDPRSSLSAEVAALIGDAAASSSSLPLLGMGRDVPDGVMRIRRGHLDIDWTTATSRSYFDRVNSTMGKLAAEMGAEYRKNPLWWLKRVITVHPLGGLPMGRHIGEGVVDPWGEAFGSPGLHVVDGSAMPGPVGPNPSLTIAAFANRAADHLIEAGRDPATGTATRPAVVPAGGPTAPPPPPTSDDDTADDPATLSFTEEMRGFVSMGASDFGAAYEVGRADGTSFMFHLTITAEDVHRFLADADHHGSATGWIDSDIFGGRLAVEHGDFNLFVDDAGPSRTHMYYRLLFADGVGQPLTMTGYKDVHDDRGFDVWSDTSTLYIRVLRGHIPVEEEAGAEIVASGMLRIRVPDFIRQLTSFRVKGGSGPVARVAALAAFGRSFMGDLWDVFGGRAESEGTVK